MGITQRERYTIPSAVFQILSILWHVHIGGILGGISGITRPDNGQFEAFPALIA